jgi:hypothetical protein
LKRFVACAVTLAFMGLVTMFVAPSVALANDYAGYYHTNGYGVRATIYTPASQPTLYGGTSEANPSFSLNFATSYYPSNGAWVQVGWVCRHYGSTYMPCVNFYETNDPVDSYYYRMHLTTTLAWNSSRAYECVYIGAVGSEYNWQEKISGTVVSSPTLHLPASGNDLQLMAEQNVYENQNRGKYTQGGYKSTSGGSYQNFSGTRVPGSPPFTWVSPYYPYQFTVNAN